LRLVSVSSDQILGDDFYSLFPLIKDKIFLSCPFPHHIPFGLYQEDVCCDIAHVRQVFFPINYRESCEYWFELSWIFMKRNNVVHKKKDIFIKKKKAYTKNELFNLRMNFFHQEFKFIKILQIFILITLKLNKK